MIFIKNRAQSIIEFTLVFLVILSLFFSIIEFSLFWRAQNSLQNIANEMIANAQITAQNSHSELQIANKALEILNLRSGLLNVPDQGFSLSGSGKNYLIQSNFSRNSVPVLSANVKINDIEKSDITITLLFSYKGMFYAQDGETISSCTVQSVQKF